MNSVDCHRNEVKRDDLIDIDQKGVMEISAQAAPPLPERINQAVPARTRSRQPDQPKFPHGLFEAKNWDIGRDFESLVEIGRGKYVLPFCWNSKHDLYFVLMVMLTCCRDTMIYKGFCKTLNVARDSSSDSSGGCKLGLEVAIKVYSKNKVSHTKLRAIKREVAMMIFFEKKRVPNTVKIYAAFADDLNYYLVMEYCSGGDLLEWILDRKKAMHERDAMKLIGLPMLDSLCHLHSMQIIHRDIKLENIFLNSEGQVKLGDFGLTMCRLQETAISPVGTVEYMAPEVVSLPSVDKIINRQIDPKTITPTDEKVDIWALGVTLYELVTGKLPFGGQDKQAIKKAILSFNLASFPESVSLECQSIILDMLSYRAEDRPSAFTTRRRIAKWLNRDSTSTETLPLLLRNDIVCEVQPNEFGKDMRVTETQKNDVFSSSVPNANISQEETADYMSSGELMSVSSQMMSTSDVLSSSTLDSIDSTRSNRKLPRLLSRVSNVLRRNTRAASQIDASIDGQAQSQRVRSSVQRMFRGE
jgi:serine/threonine protein kinase